MSYYITAHAAVRYYMLAIKSGDREVGGYAKFHVDEHGNHIVTDLRPIRQESSQCYFEIDEKQNALFLEQLVSEGEDPKDWGMLFHTHPEGMDAEMSGVDVTHLTEMAKDLPGNIARSMILGQGMMQPMIHEAVSVEGRVFMRQNTRMKVLDTTGAEDDLKKIGFFDKPKVVPLPPVRTGFTAPYAAGRERATFAGRQFSNNDGWYDEMPERSEVDPMTTRAYSNWLDDKWQEADDDKKDEADLYIGEFVLHHGDVLPVIDAYTWEGDIVLILPDNTEMRLEDAHLIETQEQAAQ